MKLWDKGADIDTKIIDFTVGNDREIDVHIAKYDVQATRAHVKMLNKIGILTDEELKSLLPQLDILEAHTQNPDFFIEPEYEDIHSKLEAELTLILGDTGKKVHTARSRNDQVLVALQLYYKEQLQQIKARTVSLFETLMTLGETHEDKLLPGYTHLQVAMPSSFGLWFTAYAELLIDDVMLINATQDIVDQNPLGSAAGYGSSFPIDRQMTTKELGFATMKYNVVAAQMARGKSERTLASTLGSLANTLSRFAMDVCLYMSQNFGFVSFPEHLTTGSSIMPHKKNPDVFELIRGKCNKIQSLSTEMVLITNNLPSGYHRDYQLLKENTISAVETIKDILEIFDYAIGQVIVKEIDLNDEKYKYLFTVDSINDLVVEGKSFREAYQQIGGQVQDGTYKPEAGKNHTHIGSIHNPGFAEIKAKMRKVSTALDIK
ncbi:MULTISPECIES: argininosuccinate lyase [Leeuwenhoekiella]|jgi:argininosuccinate lyase|uniref:argininosuccinate lyase n=1 Tax=Leeuwenhoekiella TaxID=283735 RepID=UPI000C43CDE6|nr:MULTISPECIES: argininosuccinate lyase [Leeuwenhoekiella]MAO42189.1 argininosuccinate lyase [Leeuwenhoekiella sp.]MBQ53103.1 argininosuccinate lyase [Leeuwenhoekiella sp.]HBT10164.1 argininosuccinate lyase [Leeuwenhoekiella sp.]HCW63404.1 argininosuccinate lyase [Leeuwenhoekiella sp.]|tara:strand:- start:1469 stop:2767 length:1299 start_codon:yes stop_codon:yes gene_type:complete